MKMRSSKVLLFVLGFVPALTVFSHKNHLQIMGEIGKYPIEMFIESIDFESGEIAGKYRYASKDKYLTLKGNVAGDCVIAEEFHKDESTGVFFLTKNADSLTGKWIGGSVWFPVKLKIVHGNDKLLQAKTLEDYRLSVSPSIQGAYGTENYWINDMWFREDKPQLELGFNGGYAVFEQTHKDSLKFQIEVICGPTYHMAYAEGVAHKDGDKWTYTVPPWNEKQDPCIIDIIFGDRSVNVRANYSGNCGFGVRAYLNHEFTKISDEVNFGEDANLLYFKGLE